MASKDSPYHATLAVATDAAVDQEQILLHRIAQGDATAFWTLWERYASTNLSSYCLQWMGGNREDAEDALSSASVRALKYLPLHAHKIKNVKAWLTRLLYNHCMTLQRARQRHMHYVQSTESVENASYRASRCTQIPAEEAMLIDERSLYIRHGIHTLPPRLREPVILYFYGEMSQQDIATCLNLSHENVRKRLQHARAMLRAQLTPYLQGEMEPRGKASTHNTSSPPLVACVLDEAPQIPQVHEEIKSQVVAIRTVRVTSSDGIERHVHLALDHKPARQHQKVETLRAYIQRHPTGWRKRLQLAELLYTLGDWEEALAAYRYVLNRKPCDLDVQLRLGHLLHRLHREDEAIAVYQTALRLPVKAATQHHVTGCIAMCQRHLEKAVRSFTAAAALEPHNAAHWEALGLTHLNAEQPVEALQAFETALEINPDNLVALTYSHAPLVDVGRDAEALRRMERALHLDSGHILALTRLADSHCRMGWVRGESDTQTRALLRRALQAASGNPDVAASRAYYHITRGQWNTGRTVLREFTTKYPFCPDGWYHYAQWCVRTGALQQAAEAIMHAYTLAPNDAPIHRAACRIVSSMGPGEDVRRLLNEMLRRFPNNWSAWVTAGRVLVERFRDTESACAVSAHAPILQPNLSQAWFKHGRVLLLAGKHHEAIAAFEHGWQLLPPNGGNTFAAPVALWLGESYHALGEAGKRRKWWATAVQRAHTLSLLDRPAGFYWQGKALAALGQPTNAHRAYCAALRSHVLYPACLEVKSALQQRRPGTRLSVMT